MPDPTALLFEKAASQGITVLMLLAGIYYVAKLLSKTMEARVTDLKERIAAVEGYSKACEQDRQLLWARIAGKYPDTEKDHLPK